MKLARVSVLAGDDAPSEQRTMTVLAEAPPHLHSLLPTPAARHRALRPSLPQP